MKRLWSKLITGPALACLIAVWALPTLAYYPPVKLKITKRGSHEVIYHAKDPENNNYYGDTERFVTDLAQADGMMAMAKRLPGSNEYYVIYATYDPYRKSVMRNVNDQNPRGDGPYTTISPLKVADGVVCYIAVQGDKTFFVYATYDPKEGQWRKMKQEPIVQGTPVVGSDYEMETADGVVYYGFKATTSLKEDFYFFADIYNPIKSNWDSALDGLQNNIGGYGVGGNEWVSGPTIEDATIKWTLHKGPSITIPYIAGYDYSTEQWNSGSPEFYSGGSTRPLASFVAQPSSGGHPLWVWFTDMSIGALSVDWSFGDGVKENNKRSTYHMYADPGTFTATQEITVPNVELPPHIKKSEHETITVN